MECENFGNAVDRRRRRWHIGSGQASRAWPGLKQATAPCLQHSEPAERERICATILEGSDEEIAVLVKKAKDTGAVNNAVTTARRMLRETEQQLKVVPANKYHDALKGLIDTLDGMLGQFAE